MIHQLVILLAVALVGVFTSSASGQQAPSQDEKPLLFLAEENDPPWSYNENGALKGRDIDFAVALGKKLGRSVRVELTDWDRGLTAVQQGEADGILFVAESDVRRQTLEISDPVFLNSLGIFVRFGEVRIHDLDDLNNRKVGVIGIGSDPRGALAGRPKITLVNCANYKDAFGRLASEQIDAVVTSSWLGAYWVQQQPGLKFTLAGEPSFALQPAGVGLRKGDLNLLNQINAAIRSLKNGGDIARIETRWRPQEILFLSRQKVDRAVFLSVSAFVGLLVVSMGLWIVVLQRQRQRLRLLAHAMHSANDCIVIADPNDKILMVNAAFHRTFEYEDSEIIGQHINVLRANNNASDITNEILPSTVHGGWRGELWNRSKSGRVFPISLNTSPLNDDRGRLVATVGVARDITLERQAANALRASQERFAKLFHASPDWISLAEMDTGNLLEVNERFEQITGYSRTEILGRSASDIGLFADPSLHERLLTILKEGIPVRDFEYELRRRSGEIATILASVEPIEIAGCRYTLSVHHDVTMRRKMEEQLRQGQKMEAIGRLAAGIAHDFNNLLTIISMSCELTKLKLQPDSLAIPALTDIQATTARAASLTQQLLAFSRQQSIQPRVLDLNKALLDVRRMLALLIGEKIELDFLQGDQLGSIKIDEGQLQQIILNLALNARDAMPTGGKLLLETCNVRIEQKDRVGHPEMPVGDYVLFAVTDSGSGIDAATKARIFEPFFTTKERGKGTGLGLATVYGIVKQNNGFIWVYSELGLGTTFKVYFPRLGEAVSPFMPEPSLAATKGDGLVLLVEDEDVLREKLAEHLAGIGYRVISARDGEDALQKCDPRLERPGLLITDVGLPGINGRQLAQTLSARLPDLKILYLSGYTDDAVLRNGVLPSGSFFLQKPFALDSFAQKVYELFH